MTTRDYAICGDNIARLNQFLDQFPDGGCDPEFDDTAEYLDREFAGFHLNTDHD